MTLAPQSNSSWPLCDLDFFQPQQAEQVADLTQKLQAEFESLDADSRQALSLIWGLIAQATAPIAINATSRQSETSLQHNLESLSAAGFIWYDTDLRCVLQCPPFSALTTNHRVKAFGWDNAQVCSLVDAPLALLLYGPNTWMTVCSICHYSGEELEFQMMVDDNLRFRTHMPLEARDWHIWVPSAGADVHRTDHQQHAARSFFTAADFETYRESGPEEAGVLYDIDEAMAFSRCLLRIYHKALNP